MLKKELEEANRLLANELYELKQKNSSLSKHNETINTELNQYKIEINNYFHKLNGFRLANKLDIVRWKNNWPNFGEIKFKITDDELDYRLNKIKTDRLYDDKQD